jgi:hypothetical protein
LVYSYTTENATGLPLPRGGFVQLLITGTFSVDCQIDDIDSAGAANNFNFR